jgi:poly-gamma-glutamate synthesis protein (capsule biosynthesis protein)
VKNGRLLKKNGARIIPCSLSGKTYTNDFQPGILKGQSKKRMILKMRSCSKGMNVKIKNDGRLR